MGITATTTASFSLETLPSGHVQLQETLDKKRRRWSSLLHSKDYHTVIREVLSYELGKYANSTSILPKSMSKIMRECILILASAPLIFTAAVDGILTTRFRADQDLQEEYAQIQERAHRQPSIYVHLLADEEGLAPTANQYMVIRDIILKYITYSGDAELAWKIDNVSNPKTSTGAATQGYRKYLWTTDISSRRLKILTKFCDGVYKRWMETPPAERETPMAFPPGECGYALNSHKRLEQHRKHISSNYLMNLVSDICVVLHRDLNLFPHLFSMHQFIIYLIFKPQQVEIAEIFCSGLLQVWIEIGGGFNHYPAGLSTASAKKVTPDEWREHDRFVRDMSPLEHNLKVQRALVDEYAAGLNEGMAGELREALESHSDDEDDIRDVDFKPDDVDTDE
ncbi:hypothetical protein CC78DRAFT_608404 [Lojkania enalia]|uniref:Uncharacterized protein n=1 Tax=Lojkania enalia TaxID=147567 RepID=A0A9P4K5H1_9PLEO|nr:hypothetical protein CC78DRAFT_608404 [Didymosphaeria enalia]